MDVSEHPLDKPIQRFADALEEWLGGWGRRISQVLWKEYQKRPKGLRRFLGRQSRSLRDKQAGLLGDEELWQRMADDGYALAFGFINEAGQAGLVASEEALLKIGIVLDYETVNPEVAQVILRNAFRLVGVDGTQSIVYATREQLRRLMATLWTQPDLSGEGFLAALEHLFGRTRAEAIAITEMTRAYADAALEAARVMGQQLGLRMGYNVLTANDQDVCEVCVEAAAGGPYPIEDVSHKPSLHPRCRCEWSPVVLED
jgi:hypothetical protein